ncbi:MAG TPA: NUDIX hydrolase [Actinomycetota bacterium]
MRTERQVSAGGVVARDGKPGVEVLLASRRVRSGDLVWGLPKGLVEPGETPEEAAVREVREETGWRAEVREPLGSIDYWFVWEGTRVHKVVHFFLMGAVRDEGERDHEMEEIAWFPLQEARRLAAYETEREVLGRAARAAGVPDEPN